MQKENIIKDNLIVLKLILNCGTYTKNEVLCSLSHVKKDMDKLIEIISNLPKEDEFFNQIRT